MDLMWIGEMSRLLSITDGRCEVLTPVYHINSKQKLNPESGFIVEELLGVQKSAATETSHSLTLPTLLDGHLG